MPLYLGDEAPDFVALTTDGEIAFHAWARGSWVVLFYHPRNFTPVCTTELGRAASLKDDFAARGVKLIGLSVDPLDEHERWAIDIAETQGHELNFPLVSDPNGRIAKLYDMIPPAARSTATVRSVFVIDPALKIRLTLTYPASTGRNFDEMLRVVDSLQLTDRHLVATPANWKAGEDVIILPTLSDDDATSGFPKGWTMHRTYLRTTPQPE